MKKPTLKPSFLQVLYLLIYLALFLLIIFTPALIDGPVRLSKRLILAEDVIEGVLVGIQFLLGIVILILYKNEVRKHRDLAEKASHDKRRIEERLTVSDQYIGTINVQIQEIKAIFNNIERYPESKADLKKIFRHLGARALVIVNANWVLLRIIDRTTHRTIIEQFAVRSGNPCEYPHVSNKSILERKSVSPFHAIVANPPNLDLISCCITPSDSYSHDQQVFLRAIINEITKLFLIVNSEYYKGDPVTR